MPGAQNTSKLVIGFALLCILLAAGTILVLQQLGGKVYEYSSEHGEQGKRFQESLAKFSSTIFLMDLVLLGSGATLLIVALKNKPDDNAKSKDLDELAALLEAGSASGSSSGDGPPEERMKRLRESINRLNLEILEARKRERAVIERAVDVICITDIESKFVSVSKACQNAWGYTPQELEKRSLMNILVSDDASSILNSILGSQKSIDKIVFECKLRKKAGDLIDVVWTGHWSASDGGLFCIVHDITERKRAEELVKESESRLRLTLEGLPAGVLITGNDGGIEFANSEAARMLCAETLEICKKKLASVIGERQALEIEDDGQADKTGSQRTLALATRSDGTNFPIDISESKIELAGLHKDIVVFLDKTKEQELEQMKREFIAMVTHDIRTPLSSVAGILALLEEGVLGQLTDHGRGTIGRVKSTCNRLLRLINDLLDLEKIHAGKFALECKDTSIKHAIDQAAENLLPLADERKISLQVDSAELQCWADEDRLVQVLVNLISNSIKYSPDNSTIRICSEDADKNIKVSVIDKGRGIPADKINKVFSQFEQVDISDAKKKGGTGLGLAICEAIVKEHGGDIGVTSTLGEGSRFWFTLPKAAQSVD